MTARPEYVKCIAETHQDRIGRSLCGRTIGVARPAPIPENPALVELVATEWVFTSIDHAFHNARAGGRLLVCSLCALHTIQTLERGRNPTDS